MPAELKVIHMGRAHGKTTEALKFLHDNGGGVFITTEPIAAMAVAKHHNFEGISILPIGRGTNIAIDDVDRETGKIAVSSNYPVTLDYLKTSNESGK